MKEPTIEYIFKGVGLIALLKIALNTGMISERINVHSKSIQDHETRLRVIESK